MNAESVRAYRGDAAKLDLPELFVYRVVLPQPDTLKRLHAMEFLLAFDDLAKQLTHQCSCIVKCCNEVSYRGIKYQFISSEWVSSLSTDVAALHVSSW